MRLRIACFCLLALNAFGELSFRGVTTGGLTVVPHAANLYRNQAVVGVPYSGEWVAENVRTLANGARITTDQGSEPVWRDGQWRTRSERVILPGPVGNRVRMIEIIDPAAGFYYVLDGVGRVAHRLTLVARPVGAKSTPQSARSTAARSSIEKVFEDLGTQTIDGFLAQGKGMRETTPVGYLGNDRPMVRITQEWYSPELRVNVLLRQIDPLVGERTSRLTKIDRSEPDASLFQPPPDYALVDEAGPFFIRPEK